MTVTTYNPTAEKTRRTTKPKREVIATDAPNTVAVQGEIPGTEQERIPAIERVADKYAEKQRLIDGLKDELTNLDAKLREVVHEHADKVDRNGEGMLVYKRGDYSITITPGKEKLKVAVGREDEAEDAQ